MNRKLKKYLDITAFVLVIVGAINWLVIGLGGTNFVETIFKTNAKYVYDAVGISGLYSLQYVKKMFK